MKIRVIWKISILDKFGDGVEEEDAHCVEEQGGEGPLLDRLCRLHGEHGAVIGEVVLLSLRRRLCPHVHHHFLLVHLVVSVVGVVVDLVVGVAVLHLVHHLGEHGGHVDDVLVVVSLVDHRVDESVARPVGGKRELRSIFVAALGNSLLHVDHDKLRFLLALAAFHGLQLLPLLDHLVVHATKGNGGEGKHDKKLHVVSVSLQGSCSKTSWRPCSSLLGQ